MRSILSIGRSRHLRILLSRLPKINFLTVHYSYFILTGLFSAVVFWGSSTPAKSVSFTDSLFLCVSAMTEAGLNTVNLSTLNTWQQIMLLWLIIIGSPIFVSAFIVLIRLKTFENEFEAIVKEAKEQRQLRRQTRPLSRSRSFFVRPVSQTPIRRKPIEKSDNTSDDPDQINTSDDRGGSDLHPNLARTTSPSTSDRHLRFIGVNKPTGNLQRNSSEKFRSEQQSSDPNSSQEDLATLNTHHDTGILRPLSQSGRSATTTSHMNQLTRGRTTDKWFDSSAGYFSRNSQVHDLTQHERLALGGKEYAAVMFLAVLVPMYIFFWQVLGAIAVGAWISNHQSSVTLQNGLNPWWVGIFNAVSAFNNSGMSLLDANMTAFTYAIYVLITMGLLILAGNTAYPIFLRIIIWTMWKVMPDDEVWADDKANLRFLLDHPRRCYTNLFPSRHTWWLGLTLIILNGIDWAMFEILNIGNHLITSIPSHIEVLDGLFQALAVRSGGFYVVPIPNLRIAVQVLYVVMMYISVYPVVITMRNSNVYEERSLGIFVEPTNDDGDDDGPDGTISAAVTNTNEKKGAWQVPAPLKHGFSFFMSGRERQRNAKFVQHQVRAQLAHDAWWIVLAIWLVTIIETDKFEDDPVTFSVFNIIFEVVSAYGCVGISVGLPYAAYSFCGAWRTLSKLILIAVMLRGRHRGLPVSIDHAVQLPNKEKWLAEARTEDDGPLERESTRNPGQV